MARSFFLTTITVEVLSEGTPVDEDMTLADVDHFIGDGGVGRINFYHSKLTPQAAANALKEFGSKPSVFKLNDKGQDQ